MNAEGGPGESLGIMYGTLLRSYEAVKEDYSLIRKRYDDLVSSHSAAVNKLEHSQVGNWIIFTILIWVSNNKYNGNAFHLDLN